MGKRSNSICLLDPLRLYLVNKAPLWNGESENSVNIFQVLSKLIRAKHRKI